MTMDYKSLRKKQTNLNLICNTCYIIIRFSIIQLHAHLITAMVFKLVPVSAVIYFYWNVAKN